MKLKSQLYAPAALPPTKQPLTFNGVGEWVGPRTDMDAVAKKKKTCPCRESIPTRPARSMSRTLSKITADCFVVM